MMINEENIRHALKILELRTKVLNLSLKQVALGNHQYITELKSIDTKLCLLKKSIVKYDFVARIKSGNSLLVGEGNLSFTVSLIKKLQFLSNFITSTYEDYKDLSDITKNNIFLLRKASINVVHNLDATKLHETFDVGVFDTIIFQFPHSGSRDPIKGLNPNYVLVRDFIISAFHALKNRGVILITVVDSDFYNNMFRFDELSQELKIPIPIKYKFDPADYPEYEHTMTHKEESGIDQYPKFATWEFRL